MYPPLPLPPSQVSPISSLASHVACWLFPGLRPSRLLFLSFLLSLSPFFPLLPSSSHDPPAHFDHATNNANQTAAASADQPTFEEGKHFWPSLLLPSGQGPSLRRYMAPRNANDGAAFTNFSILASQFRNIEVHYSKIQSFFYKTVGDSIHYVYCGRRPWDSAGPFSFPFDHALTGNGQSIFSLAFSNSKQSQSHRRKGPHSSPLFLCTPSCACSTFAQGNKL